MRQTEKKYFWELWSYRTAQMVIILTPRNKRRQMCIGTSRRKKTTVTLNRFCWCRSTPYTHLKRAANRNVSENTQFGRVCVSFSFAPSLCCGSFSESWSHRNQNPINTHLNSVFLFAADKYCYFFSMLFNPLYIINYFGEFGSVLFFFSSMLRSVKDASDSHHTHIATGWAIFVCPCLVFARAHNAKSPYPNDVAPIIKIHRHINHIKFTFCLRLSKTSQNLAVARLLLLRQMQRNIHKGQHTNDDCDNSYKIKLDWIFVGSPSKVFRLNFSWTFLWSAFLFLSWHTQDK